MPVSSTWAEISGAIRTTTTWCWPHLTGQATASCSSTIHSCLENLFFHRPFKRSIHRAVSWCVCAVPSYYPAVAMWPGPDTPGTPWHQWPARVYTGQHTACTLQSFRISDKPYVGMEWKKFFNVCNEINLLVLQYREALRTLIKNLWCFHLHMNYSIWNLNICYYLSN